MLQKKLFLSLFVMVIFAFGFTIGKISKTQAEAIAQAAPQIKSKGRVFEIRTYTTNEGKLDALHARFRNHTMKLFEKHGITNIGYWSPEDSPLSQNTLIYIIAHPSREAAKKNWDEFMNDPEWKKTHQESEANGKLVSKVDSVFMEATDYSPLK
ncbi:MAG: NIPSNAP family protein [Pyrinomonadaceae bacterium]